jgi:hypothetical protein
MTNQKLKIKIKKWFIFTEFGAQAVPYILYTTNLDVDDEEITLCIREQIYRDKKWKK